MATAMWAAALFILGAMVIGYLPAQLLRRRYGPMQPADTRAVASDVMSRIGALHGLILALVFASAHQGAQTFSNDMTEEASAAIHVYFNAQRYGAPQLQSAVVAYLQTAADGDWSSLRERGKLSDEGWLAWRALINSALTLEPEGRRQQVLADKILSDVWRIEDLRQARGYEARERVPVEFWIVGTVGLLLIATLLFVHEVTPLHQGIMAMYSGFTGLTLFLIYDMSHPFSGALSVGPEAFEVALATIRSGI